MQAMSTKQETIHTCHKEVEGQKVDQADQQSLCNTLGVNINPLNADSHPDGALIITGQMPTQLLMQTVLSA